MGQVYMAGLVAEQHYQPAIRALGPGDRIFICHEADNPYDDQALCAKTRGGETIGYLARDHWLRRAIHEEGRGVTATIHSTGVGQRGFIQVVLSVTLSDDDVYQVDFDR